MAEDVGVPFERSRRDSRDTAASPQIAQDALPGHPTIPLMGHQAPLVYRNGAGRHAAPSSRPSVPGSVYRAPPPLNETVLFNRLPEAPHSGWRRALYLMSAGRINPAQSARERRRELLLERITQPIDGDFRVAVLSIKGGVGKTTTTLGMGSVFARCRTDRVIAVDANPDRGTLAQRVQQRSTATVSGLLASPVVERYSDVRAHTRMSDSRLEVLGSDADPSVAEAFSEADYRRAIDVLRNYYSVILSDCGTGIMHSAMAGVLDLAHAVVVVTAPSLDAMKSAAAALKWLTLHGFATLSRESHLVISAARPGASSLKLESVGRHFEARCRSIHLIPFDPHLAEGGEVDVELLRPATYRAYAELAAAVADSIAGRAARGEPTGARR